jgi:hypothetical protein
MIERDGDEADKVYGSGDWTIYFLRQLRPIGGQNETNRFSTAALGLFLSLS